MLRPGQVVALCVLALLTLGVVMVNSASMTVAPKNGLPAAPLTLGAVVGSKPTLYMGLAVAALALGAFMPVRSLASAMGVPDHEIDRSDTPVWHGLVPLACALGAIIVILALVYTPLVGHEANGSRRWIRVPVPGLGNTSMQPSEIAKWAMVVVVASYCVKRAAVMHQFWRGLVPGLLVLGSVAGFIVLEDLGTGVLIAAVACIMLLAAGARLWQFLMFVPVAFIGLIAAIVTNPYRINRLTAFLDPYLDPKGIGYHMIQSMRAVAGGAGPGLGLGHGQQKFGYLPEDTTDFLFAIICEELGIAGACVVIGLFGCLVWSGYSIMRREHEPFLKLVALGILATLGLQAIINLAVVTGLGPTKGIALPLVSSGGTGWILTSFSLGLLAAIDRTQPHREVIVSAPRIAAA